MRSDPILWLAALALGALALATETGDWRGRGSNRAVRPVSSAAGRALGSNDAERASNHTHLPSQEAPPSTPRMTPAERQLAWQQLDEDELLRAIGELGPEDSQLALQLVREANARFPNSPREAERAYFEVRALVNSGQLPEAVARARLFLNAHPDHPLANDAARHLLTHPLTHPTEVGRR